MKQTYVAQQMYAVAAEEGDVYNARAFFTAKSEAEVFCNGLNADDNRGCDYAIIKVWLTFAVIE